MNSLTLLGLDNARIVPNVPESIIKLEGLPFKRVYISTMAFWEGVDKDLLYRVESTLVRFSVPLSQGIRIVP